MESSDLVHCEFVLGAPQSYFEFQLRTMGPSLKPGHVPVNHDIRLIAQHGGPVLANLLQKLGCHEVGGSVKQRTLPGRIILWPAYSSCQVQERNSWLEDLFASTETTQFFS
jgi:hypothetical protein